MPSLTINGTVCHFEPGETVLQAANNAGVEIPYYCYHDALSIPAQCRICLAEMAAPNPRNENKLEPIAGGKLLPTCSTPAQDGMVVRANSPKAVANQKAVMEYLLINHPLDCPVCDQAGECELQDYSFKYGRGVSRFQEQKVKQPKKDLGPNVYIYSDRCIMCTRCVRFTKEVPGTGELTIDGRGNGSQIDVFPGVALDNELSANVIDLCPVGALLDKDFLFTQRVWFLKKTPSIDGLTSSGDNLWVEHNEGRVYRVKPRKNMSINKWWITDEVRYGWKFIHSDDRLTAPERRQHGVLVEADQNRACADAIEGLQTVAARDERLALLVSPMLTCEDAYQLAMLAQRLDDKALVAIGPIPMRGEDKVFPPNAAEDDPKRFVMRAEKAPNARGVRRVLEAVFGQGNVLPYEEFEGRLSGIGAAIVTGNYPSDWSDSLTTALGGKFTVVMDSLDSTLARTADIVLPTSSWLEKAGTFENAANVLQTFEQAVPEVGASKSEAQHALDLLSVLNGDKAEEPVGEKFVEGLTVIDEQAGQVPMAKQLGTRSTVRFNASHTRATMAESYPALEAVRDANAAPRETAAARTPAVEMVEL
ncbi:MAG: 2Fe-2S iron-sulfur cluster-binding protein [Planctomycetota bacterium]